MNPQNPNLNPDPLLSTNPQPATRPVVNQPEPTPGPPITGLPKRRPKIKVLLISIAVLMFTGSLLGAYALGRSSKKPQVITANTTPFKTLSLPPEAIVAAECAPGRGKQYIIPKDIPKGPIFDVNNNRVIAVEYLISVEDLLSKPDALTDRITDLTKNYQVDHFALVPTAPRAGEAARQVHLIMFIVSKSEAAAITCDTSSTKTTTDSSTE